MSGTQGLKTLFGSQLAGQAYEVTRSPEAAPFWQGCREGRLLLPNCKSCKRFHFYPRRFCPYCDAWDIQWLEASGRGRIYAFAVVRQPIEAAFKSLVPYCIAIIDLDEKVRMLSRIVDDVADVGCDMAVRVRFDALSDTLTVPVFALEIK